MKLLFVFFSVILFNGYCSCALNQETLIQCLKLKTQYPNINLNCEDLLNQNQNNDNNNSEKISQQVVEEGAQENNIINNINSEQQTLNKDVTSVQSEENNSSIQLQNNEREFKNINDVLNKIVLRLDKSDNQQKMILNKLDIMDNEIKLIKSQIEKINLTKNFKNNVVRRDNGYHIPNPKMKLKKQTSHIRPNKITLKKRTNFQRQLPLKRKKKVYLKKIIPKKPLPYLIKKNKRNVNLPNKLQKVNIPQNNPSNNNMFDIELLKKLIAQQQLQQQRANSTKNVKKVENTETVNDDMASNIQSPPSTHNENNISNVFKVKKRVVNAEQEKFQHEKHKKLNEEASKLFEALKMLKTKQKGILSNLSVKKNLIDNNQMSEEKLNQNIGAVGKNIISKQAKGHLSDKNLSENVSNNDSSLTEIEKQIKLLNSLNTNNSSK